jgi:hypothetical protein
MHPFQKHFADQSTASDKLAHHGYQRIYPWFLGHFVDRDVDLLEIGIHKTESLRLWKGYFKKIRLCGIDRDEIPFSDNDVRVFQVDQSKTEDLRRFRDIVGNRFDIIIDDGSHVPSHQILTLKELWVLLRPGGVYVIEDIETSYWKSSELYGYSFDSRKENVVRFTSQLIDEVNSEFRRTGDAKRNRRSALANEVEIVAFAYNCVVIVKKDPQSFASYYNRPYRLASQINSRSLWLRITRRLMTLLRSRRI